jgi:hypothetical protein
MRYLRSRSSPMKLTLIRALTVAGLVAMTASAHASDVLRWLIRF